MMQMLLRVGLLVTLLACVPANALGTSAGMRSIDWGAILRALGSALDSWRLSPFPPPVPTATTDPQTATRSHTGTRTPTSTRTPTRTRTSTRTRTATRTPSHTRTPTDTVTPRPTSTPTPTSDPALATPTRAADGQIGLGQAGGIPPAQKLASALVVFPYIVHSGTEDTRIELMNMSDSDQTLQCFYVRQSDCVEVGFVVALTAQQPLSWLAGTGANNPLTFTAVPPFDGVGELKCAVMPSTPDLASHNVMQGRALVFDTDGAETVGYGAIGFQRLVPGGFPGVVDLDGGTYEECPDRLHFQVLTRQGGVASDLVVTPCAQDLLTQTPTQTTVQLAIVNEFEQVFSSSFRFGCHARLSFSRISTLSKALLGTDTAHLIVRGVDSPLVGLVVDRFDALGMHHTTANDPFLEGGRAATVVFP